MAVSYVSIPMIPLAERNERDDECYKTISSFMKAFKKRDVENVLNLIEKQPHLACSKLPPLYAETFLSLKTFKKNFTTRNRQRILDKCLEIFHDQPKELLFFASARLDVEKLQQVIATLKTLPGQGIDQVRDCDTPLFFVLKLGDPSEDNFLTSLQILIKNNVNVNRCNSSGQTPIDYIVALHKSIANNAKNSAINKHLKEAVVLILNSGFGEDVESATRTDLETQFGIDFTQFPPGKIDHKTKVLNWIVKKNKEALFQCNTKKSFANIDDGENTILQLVLAKFEDCPEIVKFLLDNKADPNSTTKRNPFAPLELAALKNYHKSFQLLLNHKLTRVTEDQYNNFVISRGVRAKTRYFQELLESNKLKATYVSKTAHNTPLHYALIFSYKNAILKQLKNEGSLLAKNYGGKCGLDLIQAEDLEHYFNSCLAKDTYNCPTESGYKMCLNFAGLIHHSTDQEEHNEIGVVYRIGKSPRLQYLLKHILIHVFIYLKWYRAKNYYWFAVIIQILFYTILFVAFYFFDNPLWTLLAQIFTAANAVVKTNFFLLNKRNLFKKISNQEDSSFWKIKSTMITLYQQSSMHCLTEAFCTVITVLSVLPLGGFEQQLRPFAFIIMTVSFLLTLGYHPKLSKWSLMLQKVFKTFSLLSLFFFLPMLAFAMGFNIMFQHRKDQELFQNFFTSIFRTYIMITGEFDVNDTTFDTKASYLLFILFAITMTMILMNFWTGVAVSDIGNIEKHSEVNAFKNIVIFLKVVDDNICGTNRKFMNCCLSKLGFKMPFVFRENSKAKSKKQNPYAIDYYVNKRKHFRTNGLPEEVDDEIVNGIKEFVFNSQNYEVRNELYHIKEVTSKLKGELEGLKKTLEMEYAKRSDDQNKLSEELEGLKKTLELEYTKRSDDQKDEIVKLNEKLEKVFQVITSSREVNNKL